MSKTTMGLQARITEAAKILKIEEEIISKVMTNIGIDDDDFGLKLLDSDSVHEGMISGNLQDYMSKRDEEPKSLPEARLNAAVAILKGRDPFAKKELGKPAGADKTSEALLKTLNKNTRNLDGMTDKDLLATFDEERDEQMALILNRRAKNRPFVVLQDDSKRISMEVSLELLKMARKTETPVAVPAGDGKTAQVYRVTELNPDEQIVEICPVCSGYLFKGRCGKCSIVLPPEVNAETRAFIKLLVDAKLFDPGSIADKRVIVEAAGKGVDGLGEVFPDMIQVFNKKKKLGQLPSLIEEIEVTGGSSLHPFYSSGNKTY